VFREDQGSKRLRTEGSKWKVGEMRSGANLCEEGTSCSSETLQAFVKTLAINYFKVSGEPLQPSLEKNKI
jgi:hypothetical protein